MTDEHIREMIEKFKLRREEIERYARRAGMQEIEANGFNLNISRSINPAVDEEQIELTSTHHKLVKIEQETESQPPRTMNS